MRSILKLKMLLLAMVSLATTSAWAQDDSKTITDNRVAGTQSFSNLEFFQTGKVVGGVKYYLVFFKETDSTTSPGTVTITSFSCYASEKQRRAMEHYKHGICYVTVDDIYYDPVDKIFKEVDKSPIADKEQEIINMESKKIVFGKKKKIAKLTAELVELQKNVIKIISSWGDMLDEKGRPIRSNASSNNNNNDDDGSGNVNRQNQNSNNRNSNSSSTNSSSDTKEKAQKKKEEAEAKKNAKPKKYGW